jgi:glutaminyl-peptide cyclotransferase
MGVRRVVISLLTALVLACAALPGAVTAAPAALDYTIVHTYPHNTNAWTEGLYFWRDNFYESTGLYGRSSMRRVSLTTGAVLQKKALPDTVFGEGMAIAKGRAFVITWKENRALVYDPFTFGRTGRYNYAGEGSGLTYNGQYLVMSNLTSTIRFRDPATFKSVRSINVTENGTPVDQINALAWVKGQIWANIWLVPDILIIDPQTGNVVRRLDFSSLQASENSMGNAHDMNGIGYWGKQDRLFVTGKFWKHVYEITINP